ncbi:GNAT family N-acetyltransferase [Streptomyces zagrosensis]|uniref:L-amino acid N-acyltransferase YncA n=1 Tax=Streptomyces zagrosensis TaxID=1042984 RepID=A0A7W9QDM3_9ACTN|nr:GNAT family N-acetyltransferase [Streptomyces zagrosensis]MBB5938034.1 L-amino acid N-acyltransferase YncA [Streptomyces zagrosensis]
MTLTFVRDPQLTPALQEELVRLWVEVTNAGGAVGFVPSVEDSDVRPLACEQLDAVRGGGARLLAAYADGRLVGTVFIAANRHRLMLHWATLVTVMIEPALQGGGRGKAMLREAIDMARDLGFQSLRLGVRGGTGVDGFYATLGFKEVGRVPESIKVADDDYRDDIAMWLRLG